MSRLRSGLGNSRKEKQPDACEIAFATQSVRLDNPHAIMGCAFAKGSQAHRQARLSLPASNVCMIAHLLTGKESPPPRARRRHRVSITARDDGPFQSRFGVANRCGNGADARMAAHLDTASEAPGSDPAGAESAAKPCRFGDRRSCIPDESGAVRRCALRMAAAEKCIERGSAAA